MKLGHCKDCKKLIRWVITPKKKRLAIDPEPDEAGNVVIDRLDFHGFEYGHVLKKDEEPTTAKYMPHIASCPDRRST